ncbi:ABC transporter permease [uncultured Intestinimonas sp.]|uniref:ABC transporter permease n=1 Tax=uncultured Intestinimonas sp. TaxID=1689265 RepID=UPI0025DD67CD|nr:ABC transporter permease [uncultured Intestinimonas sp.]
MNITQAIKMAVKSISSNKGRSALTMLGIIIGLAAVIILVSYAQGQNAALRAYYESMGNNTISLYAYSYGNSGPQDVGSLIYDYCLQLDDVVGVTPNGYVYSSPTIKYESKTLSQNNGSGGIMMGGGVIVSPSGGGYNEDYPQIYLGNDKFGLCNDYEIAKGRDLSYLDVEKSNQVCVLGAATAEYLFSFADPIDKTITVDGMPFRVIGVYKSKGNTQIGGREEDQWMQESMKQLDRMILLPSTMTRYFNNNDPIQDYVVKVRDAGSIAKVTTSILGYLSGIIDTNNGYYGVNSNEEYLQQEDEATAMQQRFLGGIAAISLLVGGIGIMNIMLVTVTERTREIGIRKAIGAERRSIVTQFLIEASMICGIGGIVGIIVGYLGTLIVGKLSFNTILIPNPGTAVAAFLVSVALGIIFGLYPAVKASGLQPVVALRAE